MLKLVIKEKNKIRINRFIDWLLYMLGYTLVFIIASGLFKSVHISNEHNYLLYFLIVLLIYILNKTIKPILVTLTIPITGLTLGLFYPCINLFILKLVDWFMGPYFDLTNIYASFILAILLSIMNFIASEIINSIIKKVKVHG